MIEKWGKYFKNNFSNGPKAKIILGVISGLILISAIMLITMKKDVAIIVDGKEETFRTYKGTVKEVLDDKGIEIAEKDKVQPELDDKISSGKKIIIKKAVDVELVANNKKIIIRTAEDTIRDMLNDELDELKAEGIEFNEGVDEVTPSLDEKIEENLKIQLVNVEVVNEVAVEAIKFDSITEEDNELEIDTEEVRQSGVDGEKEITYKVVKKDGKEVSREIVKSKVTKEPVNEIIAQGTKMVYASRSENFSYKDIIYCQATAYNGGSLTATGTVPVYNPGGISTIAVDPRVIPLGSLVYVEGYGKAIAADIGGAIVGNIIDVYLNSHSDAISWGRKYDLPVYIISYPGEW